MSSPPPPPTTRPSSSITAPRPAAKSKMFFDQPEPNTIRSTLSLGPNWAAEAMPSREIASTRMAGSKERPVKLSPSASRTVLSDYNRNRKKKGVNLMEQLRELMPLPEPMTAEQLEDREADLRRRSVVKIFHRKVYRHSPIDLGQVNKEPNPVDSESNSALSAANNKDADGYSTTAYLEEITASLASMQPNWQKNLEVNRTTPIRRLSAQPDVKSPAVTSTKKTLSAGSAKSKAVRRKEAFAKLVALGNNSDEHFRDGRLKAVIRCQYVPEHVIREAGQAVPNPRTTRCKCWNWKNCGNCHFFKAYIIVSLFLAILLLGLTDHCFPVHNLLFDDAVEGGGGGGGVASTEGNWTLATTAGRTWTTATAASKAGTRSTVVASAATVISTVVPTVAQSTVSTTMVTSTLAPSTEVSTNATTVAPPTSFASTFAPSTNHSNSTYHHHIVDHLLLVDHPLGDYNYTTSSQLNSTTTDNTTTTAVRQSEHCAFKIFYIIWLSLGIAVYIAIFCIYSCQLVVHYYEFSWFLAETTLVAVYSAVLLVASIVAFTLMGHGRWAIVLGLLNSLLGLMISLSTYSSHREGLMPLMNLTVDDDIDHNQQNRILGEKHFIKVKEHFEFGF